MIKNYISIVLLLTIFLSAVGLELLQTAHLLMKGDVIEYVMEAEESNDTETKTKEIEIKDILDKIILQTYTHTYSFLSVNDNAKSHTLYLDHSPQEFFTTLDLPPKA